MKDVIFVVHEHWARKHHFDLRLQMGNVLKSWAIPKEIPMKPGVKGLAIPTEDHDLEYASFEGTIPEGFYGAGKVAIWDKGTYKLEEFTDDKVVFWLNGRKLKGKYVLIKMKSGRFKGNWLFFKS
jgi:DNA ligase D-like protein (predicted 3'-phosphoesterase)